ncbi:Pr6Pr family membrane protein [Actinoplanes couchii]|uniref:Integral membrane protein n=1 Tax=Actinoplanes couchii TaxID=403638 RepID=A0ABQ3XPT5_9ACTN|nr:Pr6Pr family membrane protein [Actinoplanes couchii]MDR6319084.1 hypothetical protein [Actinoplanes couchii]GID60427.1 hypothetical protein Aco03nite_088310 [Actinoplanes couchii]
MFTTSSLYRSANAVLVISVLTAVILEIVLLALNQIDALFQPPAVTIPFGTRLIQMFSFLTTQSNLLAGVVAAVAVIAPHRDGRIWRVVRLDALIGIAAIGIGFQILFAPSLDLTGLPLLLTVLYHYVDPLLAVLIWLLPDQRRTWRYTDVLPAMIWPATWMIFVFGYGAITHWYPYGIVDVAVVGAGAAYRTGALTLILLFLFGLILVAVDRWRRQGLDHQVPENPGVPETGANVE